MGRRGKVNETQLVELLKTGLTNQATADQLGVSREAIRLHRLDLEKREIIPPRAELVITKKRAIKLTIELWTWLAETGGKKERWDGWEKYGRMASACFLCEYNDRCSLRKGADPYTCTHCPYHQKFGDCVNGGQPYDNWTLAESVGKRKKYASEFLNQMKEIKD